jgi:hypothetical protein
MHLYHKQEHNGERCFCRIGVFMHLRVSSASLKDSCAWWILKKLSSIIRDNSRRTIQFLCYPRLFGSVFQVRKDVPCLQSVKTCRKKSNVINFLFRLWARKSTNILWKQITFFVRLIRHSNCFVDMISQIVTSASWGQLRKNLFSLFNSERKGKWLIGNLEMGD